jgi:hypothetical protein
MFHQSLAREDTSHTLSKEAKKESHRDGFLLGPTRSWPTRKSWGVGAFTVHCHTVALVVGWVDEFQSCFEFRGRTFFDLILFSGNRQIPGLATGEEQGRAPD